MVKDEKIEEFKKILFEKYKGDQYLAFLEYLYVVSKKSALLGNQQTIDKSNDAGRIANIMNFYNTYDENLINFIKGHLFLEYVMNIIISKTIKVNIKKKSFNDKINLLATEIISDKEKKLLKQINNHRNKIAHKLNYELSFDSMYELVKISAEAGVDYSDSTIYKNKMLSKEWYGITGIITEIFPNTFCYFGVKYLEESNMHII